MKAGFNISPVAAQAIISCAFENDSDETHQYGAGVVQEPDGSVAWITAGGSSYVVYPDEGFLSFTGSRRSFEDGCTILDIYRKWTGEIMLRVHARGFLYPEFDINLVSWESSVPGNPGPFDDWRANLPDPD